MLCHRLAVGRMENRMQSDDVGLPPLNIQDGFIEHSYCTWGAFFWHVLGDMLQKYAMAFIQLVILAAGVFIPVPAQ